LRKNNVGNKIIHLIDGKAALDFLFGRGPFLGRDINQKPKVILLDLKMPKVTGVGVLEVIKADHLTSKIPVVMLTSSREHPDIEKCYALGVNSYIVKPIVMEEFVKVVSGLGLYWVIHNQTPE
jgi:two-component system response regulator